MKINRRNFIKSSVALGAAASLPISLNSCLTCRRVDSAKLIEAMEKPVLKKELFKEPVIIESVELLKNGIQFLVRVRSKDGVEGVSVAHRKLLNSAYPIFINRVQNHFIGEDARDLEELIQKTYLSQLNYKWQGLAFWVCVAVLEFAILDMLGKTIGQPVGEMLGTVTNRDIKIYRASSHRGNPPRDEIEYFHKLIEETGARAIKYRLGARMRYTEESTKRDKELIPLSRKELGDDFTIYVDANGSYDVPMGIKIGKILEENKIDFFEEPAPFDYYDETKQIADALTMPIAGGEEETSMRMMRWMIENDVVQVIQPDLLFFGGMTRAVKVARMAEVAGIPCTPHMSGYGLGFLYVLHFASFVKNAGPHQEYKGDNDPIPVSSDTSSLKPKDGILRTPSGPGLGITIDPDFVNKGELVKVV